MSKETKEDIEKHGSISAGWLSHILTQAPPDTPVTCMGMKFKCMRPDMNGGIEMCWEPKGPENDQAKS